MKKILPLLVFSLLITTQTADAARGRQPCSGSKGGISHCTSGGDFVCNDGSLSQSKRYCSGYGTGGSVFEPAAPAPVKKKAQSKKTAPAKVQESHRVVENDDLAKPQPRQPTCAPLYMATKPGFTHLPICTGNQY